MKLVSRTPEVLRFILTDDDRAILLALLDLDPQLSRPLPELSRNEVPGIPPDAEQDLAEQLAQGREGGVARIRGWLCTRLVPVSPETTEKALDLDWEEADLLLQRINGIRVGAWEDLGRPNFEAGEVPELNSSSLLRLWAIQVCETFLKVLLRALMDPV